jgi:hypothetical protein
MDASNDKQFAFLHVVDDAELLCSSLGHLRVGLELCSNDCCHIYSGLYRVGNAMRKLLFVALVVYVILLSTSWKHTSSLRGS